MQLYDTTLRDGMQQEGMSVSVDEKVRIALKLDELGIDFIEGGFPASNPKEVEFFRRMQRERLARRRAGRLRHDAPQGRRRRRRREPARARRRVHAHGRHRRQDLGPAPQQGPAREPRREPAHDRRVGALPRRRRASASSTTPSTSSTPGATTRPTRCAARPPPPKRAPAVVCLCDTNGASLPPLRRRGRTPRSRRRCRRSVGVHAHNDGDCAVANSLVAVAAGARQVQGTINGYGERCGNANLVSIIPALKLKMGFACGQRRAARAPHRDLALRRRRRQRGHLGRTRPYVGRTAFAHKGGLHVAAVEHAPQTFEHVDPASVGNEQRIVVSELSGKGAVLRKAHEHGPAAGGRRRARRRRCSSASRTASTAATTTRPPTRASTCCCARSWRRTTRCSASRASA